MDPQADRGDTGAAARTAAGFAGAVPTSDTSGWGIGDVPLLWGTRIRILFVIDGRITVGSKPDEFGLGLVLDTLRDPAFAWWVRFEVTVACRDDPERFRFTNEGFKIDDYEQIWFFGDWPGLFANNPNVGDEVIGDYDPLDHTELRLLAQWMDRGGGVFAAGDHSLLGASMCHRIPRVRTMRRWTRAQDVPPFVGDGRNETLVHGPGVEDDWEGDQWPQQIYPVLRPNRHPFAVYGGSPHPILCGRAGMIEHFPDHMHEGGVFADDEVRLNDPLDIEGYNVEEYPTADPVVAYAAATTTAHATVGPEVFRIRPRPHVIAYGLTSHLAVPRPFPMISTYDGDLVGLGRVVVDSTWHHWFSFNLVGLRDLAPGYYAGMQDYYRNVALWLSSPTQRASMLYAATWGVLIGSQPGAFDAVLGIRRIGERVVDVIGRTVPECMLNEFVATIAVLPSAVPAEGADDRSWIWAPSSSALNILMVGGIAIRMVEQAHHHINEQAHGRESPFDANAVRRLGLEGVAAAKGELLDGLAQGAERFRMMGDLLAEQGGTRALGEIPIDLAD